ncbi:uncharacterized protein LOC110692374 [Chenopodium quinoa]|uniref:uncharacterized protein LOC110692374 n=1 Tax=Chenopodium quinoa TaxID=63459 RepID=UPI000B790EE1|nr:uncharacterized protein LOC110692374 [Chenopodium quinoa]
MDSVTLKYWHGGLFKKHRNELVYYGGLGKTFDVDPDELCWWDLVDLAKNIGNYSKIDTLYYLIPGMSLESGLRKVYDDKEVLEMTEIVKKQKYIQVYVVHGVDEQEPIDSVFEVEGPQSSSIISVPQTKPTEKIVENPIHKPTKKPNNNSRPKKLTPMIGLIGPILHMF